MWAGTKFLHWLDNGGFAGGVGMSGRRDGIGNGFCEFSTAKLGGVDLRDGCFFLLGLGGMCVSFAWIGQC